MGNVSSCEYSLKLCFKKIRTHGTVVQREKVVSIVTSFWILLETTFYLMHPTKFRG
jgi:hypothetical protein